jgi:SAM-dependent methyltransferase
MTTGPPLYGAEQSRFARYLERREERSPDPVARERRRRLIAGLRGRVLELACGDGRAFELYPRTVSSVLAVEPDPTARALATERAAEAPVTIEVVDGLAAALPAEDASFDAALVIWVLCSVHGQAQTERPRVCGASPRFRKTRRGAPGRGRSMGFCFVDVEKGLTGPLMSAECQQEALDRAESRLIDLGHEIVAMHRLVELLGVDVKRGAHVRVPRDLAHPHRVEAQADDQARDEHPAKIVSRYRLLAVE